MALKVKYNSTKIRRTSQLLFEHVVRLSSDVEYWYWHFSNVDLIEAHVDELFVRLNRNNVSAEVMETMS